MQCYCLIMVTWSGFLIAHGSYLEFQLKRLAQFYRYFLRIMD